MTVALQLRAAIAAGEPLDWRLLRDQLDSEHADANSAAERESLLALFKTLMDMVQAIEITPDMAAAFQLERKASYQRLVMREARGGPRVGAQTLDDITLREVRAGRMDADDPLRDAAVLAAVGLRRDTVGRHARSDGPSRQAGPLRAKSVTGWQRARTWVAGLVQFPARLFTPSAREYQAAGDSIR